MKSKKRWFVTALTACLRQYRGHLLETVEVEKGEL